MRLFNWFFHLIKDKAAAISVPTEDKGQPEGTKPEVPVEEKRIHSPDDMTKEIDENVKETSDINKKSSKNGGGEEESGKDDVQTADNATNNNGSQNVEDEDKSFDFERKYLATTVTRIANSSVRWS